ncbi:MAG: hypothetical protein KF726_10355 [Anaerolineae bacterium]|nr:hypothetical protein [Anaerolineae bacterium]
MAYHLNPERTAYFEAAGWRAYYEHAWLKMLRLIVALEQEQFHIPFPISLVAAYHVVRASAAWVPKDHDLSVVSAHLKRFYTIALRYSGLTFDPQKAAELEMLYWDTHRQASGKEDKSAFTDALTQLHATIFNLTPEQTRESAELRVRANTIVDTITSHTSTDPESDWRKLEIDLQACYRSIEQQINAPKRSFG